MTGRLAMGWQTTIADLALILFLVVSSAPRIPPKDAGRPPAIPSVTPATAVYRPSAALSVRDWLRGQPRDERLTATVLVEESGAPSSTRSQAVAKGQEMMDEIARSGFRVRMLVERGTVDDVSVILAYDQDSGTPLATDGE